MAPTRRCPALPGEIIARLPAKSVVGCHHLSRAWAATLSSDDFIYRYHTLDGGRPKIFRLQNDSNGDVVDKEAKPCAPPPMGVVVVTAESFPPYVTVFWDDTLPPGSQTRAPS